VARKLLFICSRNKIRSLTAEKLYGRNPAYAVRSAGTQASARIKVTEGLLGWADIVFCMEKAQLQRVQARYPEALATKRVVVLHIPDDYTFMQPELVDELEAKLASHLEDAN
jgi:predicted protein tyrosine phosphatase